LSRIIWIALLIPPELLVVPQILTDRQSQFKIPKLNRRV
jgi:hypothetical protein